MERVSGNFVVLGPTGFLVNPNKQAAKAESVVAAAPNILPGQPKKVNQSTPDAEDPQRHQKYLIPNFDLACEVARAAARKVPGNTYQVLKTCTVFQAEVPEPGTLIFGFEGEQQ